MFTAVTLGPSQFHKGLDKANHVIGQMTLASVSNPYWSQGRSYSKNLDICVRLCIKNNECDGIQVSQ